MEMKEASLIAAPWPTVSFGNMQQQLEKKNKKKEGYHFLYAFQGQLTFKSTIRGLVQGNQQWQFKLFYTVHVLTWAKFTQNNSFYVSIFCVGTK